MLETWWSWYPNLYSSSPKFMQSWSKYRNIFEFEEKLANNINYSTKLEVCSTYNLIYDGVQYSNNERIEMTKNTKTISCVDDEAQKRKSKLLNVDTSCYENIIYNKKDIAIQLFNEFDKQVLNINNSIKRNYLMKNVAYKLDKKIIEVQVNQSDILISFYKDIKQFDNLNKLSIRKGYEKSTLCHYIKITDLKEIPYLINLCNKLYDYLTESKVNPVDNLFNKLSVKINSIGSNVTSHYTNKGLIFKNKRNFTIISKKKYGIYIRLLNVEDNDNVLKVVGRTNYEPLCRYFKIINESDLDVIMPYIIKSYEISKYNPVDLKNNFIELYYSE